MSSKYLHSVSVNALTVFFSEVVCVIYLKKTCIKNMDSVSQLLCQPLAVQQISEPSIRWLYRDI